MARIVFVDDDEELRDLTKTILGKKGHSVLAFADAESAIQEIRIYKPDLILMDIILPGMDGVEAIEKVRENPHFLYIPVIFLSGLVSGREKDIESTGIKISGTNYKILGKPFDSNQLLEAIDSMLV